MTLIYPILFAAVCAVIEFIRILKAWGVPNINKLWTVTIGVIFFAISLALSVDYYDEIWPYHVIIYGIYYASCRGFIYDILLNILRGLPVDYKSKSTNSKIDKALYRFDFWLLKAFYVVLGILNGILWINLK